ncbi:MAG TPA: hypothetical protein VL418_06155 [Devosiaceae bacterium]|nr:hypothetical protein [Devosiaceae bacterium]
MCSLCGSLGEGPAWENDGALADRTARWRQHQSASATAVELSRLLSASRVRISAHADFGYLLQLPTGGMITASGLADVWHKLAAAGISVPDVLEV